MNRFLFTCQIKINVRGLGVVKPQKQLENLIEWLGMIHNRLSELESV